MTTPDPCLTPGSPEAAAQARRQLLALRLRQGRGAEGGTALTRRPSGASVPLSFSQEGLWFLDQLLGPNGLYNSARAFHLRGALDVACLQRSLQALLARHESLRTALVQTGADVQQQVQPAQAMHDVLQVLPLEEAVGEAALQLRLQQLAAQPFDLTRPPLLRACLLRLNPGHHVLLLVLHHIVSDGWSMGVLLDELSVLYVAGGDAQALSPLPLQYADFTLWQRERMRGRELGRQLAYWRRQLEGLATLELPTDKPRPAQASYHGAQCAFQVPAALLGPLKALAQREGATLFMLTLAVFQLLLARYAGQSDVQVGVPLAGRNRPELEGLIGYFVNTLVLRADVSGNPSFIGLLAQVRQTALDAYAHQELPFDRLVAELQPERDLSRNPLYQVSFALQNHAAGALRLPGVQAAPLDLPSPLAKFDLSMTLTEQDGGLDGVLDYSQDLFEPATVQRLAQHYQALLATVAADPSQSVMQMPLLSAAERDQLLVQWNQTAVDYPRHLGLHQLFERQARKTPQALALAQGGQVWSYERLYAYAGGLARELAGLGVGPERRVVVCMPRSPELAVALLATLQAGGAYVPLDPDQPEERLRYMVQDCAATVVLTDAPRASVFANVQAVVRVPADWPPPRPEDSALQDGIASDTASPGQLAYVIYTSGSTGRPKGVEITHQAICNHIHWVSDALGLQAQDRLLQKTSLGFDAAVLEFFAPWHVGACVVLADPQGERDLQAMAQLVAQAGITVMQMVPSALKAMLAGGIAMPWPRLRALVCGGEALDGALLAQLRTALPQVQLFNFYGPTEAAIDALGFKIPADQVPGPRVPVGRPIANARAYVLDAWRQPVPVGVPGEIHIAGAGLARGYLNNAELTRASFVDDPFHPGKKMYRTGDTGRWLASGVIECWGRRDDQVKLRGQRLELGEIEAQLASHPGVAQAVVLLRQEVGRAPALAAYVQARDPAAGSDELRQYLRRYLPDVMVPQLWVTVAQMPLLANGKVDRRALPALHMSSVTTPAAPSEPVDDVERSLCEVWQQVLGVDAVAPEDNFFDLGGHSLLAAQLFARMTARMHVALPLATLFQAPTVRALARHYREGLTLGEVAPYADIPPVPRRPPDAVVPLSSQQQGLWFLDQLMGPSGLYNAAQALELRGPLDLPRLQRAVHGLLARHESLRTACVMVDDQVCQQVQPLEALPMAWRVEAAAGNDAGTPGQAAWMARARALAGQPFDLARPPLLRAHLLPLGPDHHLLLLVLHHIASDGWSIGLVLKELSILYAQSGDAAKLPALPVQYPDFALWQQDRLRSPAMARQLAYWRGQLQDLSILNLPLDKRLPGQVSYRGAQWRMRLPVDRLVRLRALARQHNVTLFMLLLAVYQVLLARYAGQEDVVVGVPAADRARPELQGLIGYFVNMLVLRANLVGNPPFSQFLQAVRQTALQAYDNQELPFDQLVAELQPQRDASRNPLFQVSFALQNQPEGELDLPGVMAQPVELASDLSKFDLSLSLTETSQGLDTVWEYCSDLFEPATVQRMDRHFQALLAAVLREAAQPVMQLPMLADDERQQLLVQWNQTAQAYPTDVCLHQLFERQARATPQALAVEQAGASLSYRELDQRAGRLAGRLRAHGVGPDACVVVCMQRSLELPVALLAVLKAGGAFVPMDPELPAERLRYMAQDCAASVVLADAARFPVFVGLGAAVWVTSDWAGAVQIGDVPAIAAAVTPQHLAYVIYTSGSTGRPKGVQISHGAICNHIPWIRDTLQLRPDDRLLQKTSIGFDASVLEFFTPWQAGACVVLADPQGSRDLVALAHKVPQAGITVLQLVPSVLKAMLASGLALEWGGLRCLICGGEALEGQLLAQVRAAWPQLRVFNFYGPTEATIDAVAFAVPPDYAVAERVPIGRPVANVQVYVLDAWQQPVPVGVLGEIHIGGAGLARGYLNNAELTARSFIADPFHPGERLYRSGDLGRWLPNGLLECWGRNDGQVKLRGQRMELGEVEAQLGRHAQVAQAVVGVHQAPGQAPLLVAYVQPRGAMPQAAELRQHLRLTLPDTMVPQHFIAMASMPLLSNGKVDRKQLPAPPKTSAGGARAQPADDVERALCRLWAQALSLDEVAPDDNFFDLGGHSLLAAQLFARASSVMKRTLPLGVLFQAPTVRELARFYRGDPPSAGDGSPTALVPITQGSQRPPLFVVPGINGNVVGFSALAGELGADQPFFGLQSVGLDGRTQPFETIEQMAAHYVVAVRQAQPQGPYQLLGICFGGVVAFEMMRQLRGAGQTVAFLGLVDPSSQGGGLSDDGSVPRAPSRLAAARELAGFVGRRLRLYTDEMRTLSWGAKLRYLRAKTRHVGRAATGNGLLRGIDAELLQNRVTQANVRALKRYQCQAVAADTGMAVALVQVQHRVVKGSAVELDWVGLAGGHAGQHTLPGKDTGDLLLAANAKGLARVLKPYLRQSAAPET
jgi:amino acid adenylation domain-containing protein